MCLQLKLMKRIKRSSGRLKFRMFGCVCLYICTCILKILGQNLLAAAIVGLVGLLSVLSQPVTQNATRWGKHSNTRTNTRTSGVESSVLVRSERLMSYKTYGTYFAQCKRYALLKCLYVSVGRLVVFGMACLGLQCVIFVCQI